MQAKERKIFRLEAELKISKQRTLAGCGSPAPPLSVEKAAAPAKSCAGTGGASSPASAATKSGVSMRLGASLLSGNSPRPLMINKENSTEQ